VVSVVGGKGGSGLLRPGGTAGEARVGGRTEGDGGEGTQAREGGDRTLGGVGVTGRVGSGEVESIVTDLDSISALSSFTSFSTLFSSSIISNNVSLNVLSDVCLPDDVTIPVFCVALMVRGAWEASWVALSAIASGSPRCAWTLIQ
jgi:hypothetical protein